jgi:preprotein translocase subunit YajC
MPFPRKLIMKQLLYAIGIRYALKLSDAISDSLELLFPYLTLIFHYATLCLTFFILRKLSMSSFFFLLGNTDAAGGAAGTGNPILSFVPFILIIGIFYFLIIRPQNKKQKDTQKMLEALKKGDKVVTIGGIHGTIQNVREGTVILKLGENNKVEFSRSAIASVEAVAKDKDVKFEKIEEADEDDNDNEAEEDTSK